ncbi:hypothetical protein L9F63_028105, partial [Diploptera punctata]
IIKMIYKRYIILLAFFIKILMGIKFTCGTMLPPAHFGPAAAFSPFGPAGPAQLIPTATLTQPRHTFAAAFPPIFYWPYPSPPVSPTSYYGGPLPPLAPPGAAAAAIQPPPHQHTAAPPPHHSATATLVVLISLSIFNYDNNIEVTRYTQQLLQAVLEALQMTEG